MITFQTMAFRLWVAILLGSLVGVERGRTERAAGFRTHALVALGAALFMIVSEFGFSDILGTPHVDLDPSRIAAQVVTGIGFLGAGTIIFWKEKVRGLTTAASIWATAAIGLAVGCGVYFGAVVATVGALVILSVFKPIEKKLAAAKQQIWTLIVDKKLIVLQDLQSTLEKEGIPVESIVIRPGETAELELLELKLKRGFSQTLLPFLDTLRQMPGVHGITAVAKPVPLESEPDQSPRNLKDELQSQDPFDEDTEQSPQG